MATRSVLSFSPRFLQRLRRGNFGQDKVEHPPRRCILRAKRQEDQAPQRSLTREAGLEGTEVRSRKRAMDPVERARIPSHDGITTLDKAGWRWTMTRRAQGVLLGMMI